LLAGFFVMVGYSHALMPFDQIAQEAAWMNDVPRWLSLFIGYAEIAGGLGLIIPAASRLAPWLTPLAALGVATIMILAIPFHVLKGEASVIWMHALIVALGVFVAWAGRGRRLGPCLDGEKGAPPEPAPLHDEPPIHSNGELLHVR